MPQVQKLNIIIHGEGTMLYNKSGSHGQPAVTEGHRKVTQGHTCRVQTPLGTAMRS